jgi:hypothetical protein
MDPQNSPFGLSIVMVSSLDVKTNKSYVATCMNYGVASSFGWFTFICNSQNGHRELELPP